MPGVYIRSITRITMYQKAPLSIKIEYSGYPKSLISRINKVYVFYTNISLWRYFIEKNIHFIYNLFLLQSHLLLWVFFCFCDVSVTLSPALSKKDPRCSYFSFWVQLSHIVSPYSIKGLKSCVYGFQRFISISPLC